MRNRPAETMFGIENEYGITWLDLSLIINNGDLGFSIASERATDLFVYYFYLFISRKKPFAPKSPIGVLPPNGSYWWMWTNGSKTHDDQRHPEYATPECGDPYMTALHVKAGEYLLEIVLRSLNRKISRIDKKEIASITSVKNRAISESPQKRTQNGAGPIAIQKNNTDLAGNSYGTHENYLCRRNKIISDITINPILNANQFDRIRYNMIPFLITRQILSGAGGFWKNSEGVWHYVLSPRALKTSMLFNFSSTVDSARPLISIKDEPFASKDFYRLHIVSGDALMSEFATYLTIGTTWIVISMIQDGWLNGDLVFQFESPGALESTVNSEKKLNAEKKIINYFHAISYQYAANPNMAIPITGKGGLTPLEIQYQYLERAKSYFTYIRKPAWWEEDIIQKWEMALDLLRADSPEKIRYIEWASKLALMNSIIKKRTGIFENIFENSTRISPELWEYQIRRKNGKKPERVGDRLLASSIQYSNILKTKGLYWALVRNGFIARLFSETEIKQAIRFPPWTRALLREYARFTAKKRGLQISVSDWNELQVFIGPDTDRHTHIFKIEPPFGGETLFSGQERFEKWLKDIMPENN